MTYTEAMAFLEETKQYGSRPGLSGIRSLMKELGNVQERIPVVHIGGTNGKGSVGAMLSAVLTEAGYRVGRFNTPDVFSYEEEFLIGGIPVERERLAQLFTEVSFACKKLTAEGLPHPTRFEVETAAAFLWFYEEQCDLALIEVGMGGAADATNLITRPLVSILTSISMDHMQFLGNTLEEIAAEKAGIIKPGCPVVSAGQKPEVLTVIRKRAKEKNAPLYLTDASAAEEISCTSRGTSFVVRDEKNQKIQIRMKLLGQWQVENALCAWKALKILSKDYQAITVKSVAAGMRQVRWPGRMEQIAASPAFFLDGAHNADAVNRLRGFLNQIFPYERIIYIMGVLADKDFREMIQIMFREDDLVFTVTPPNVRALSAGELADQIRRLNVNAVPCSTSEEAASRALKEAGEKDVILAFGSLSYLKEIRSLF